MAHMRGSAPIKLGVLPDPSPINSENKISVELPDPSPANKENKLDENLMPIDALPDDVLNICLSYMADPIEENKAEKIYYPRTTFFKKCIAQRLHEAANDLLSGSGLKALALVTESPWVINLETDGYDRFGTCIKERTLLQMAAILGDTNHRNKKLEEKNDHGMVELLRKAANLSDEEISKQLYPVLFSDTARKANEIRKNHFFTLIKTFGESLIRKKTALPVTWNTVDELKAAQAICEPEISTLRNNLIKMVSNNKVTEGYILDSQIFVDFAEWFEDPKNLNHLGGWWSLRSDLFWIHGYGTLQYIAPIPTARIHKESIGQIVYEGLLPARSSLKNSDGSDYFNVNSRLGLDFYLGYIYWGRAWGPTQRVRYTYSKTWKTYITQNGTNCNTLSTKTLCNPTQKTTSEIKHSRCLIL